MKDRELTSPISVVVPTYGRDEVLLETVASLECQLAEGDELLVIDQSEAHSPSVDGALATWAAGGTIRWLRLDRPSIPGAMNRGLLEARCEVVVFFDDDIRPERGLVDAHRAAHLAGRSAVVAGQVLQPGEVPAMLEGEQFGFRSSVPQWVDELMGGNFSVEKSFALGIGGFDERFVDVAYRFERDFVARAMRAGARVWFEPSASVHHLRSPRGGTRSFGSHLTSLRPSHAVGEYYCLLRHRPKRWLATLLARPFRSISTRHHLRHPWWIPVTLIAELAGIVWALSLAARGPLLVTAPKGAGV